MTGWTISDADRADVGGLARIMGDWVRETPWMPVLHTPEKDENFVAGLLGSHKLPVARRGTERLGFLARQGGQVQALHVAAGSRGLGLGKALRDEVKLGEPIVELWTFQANDRAVAFYTREGFREATRTDGRGNDERLPDIRLIWRRAA
ncbi:MAG TPA: GNAT family N-acetyltransferase [Tabrizicola sp.]|nr:GNAT family N-acetyltransferase [Tabrizicola sp.]